ncbi:hypothetical protein SDC9_66150 [bioreactor metagenome]|uniref:LTD domain-containing protein n=1 Tax=bioreactor metagenome TaxID=1076179 RepID=A0A644Y0G6_9ZZZZ
MSAPADYEISTVSGSGFTSAITLTQSGGTVASTSIYVRLKDGLSAGTYNSETITASSTGATSQTVTCDGIVTTSGGGGGCATDLIISEYIEGSSNNKYIELYNGTGSSVDLSNYTLAHYNNGSATATYTLALSGTLAASATYVIENSSESLGVTADLSTAVSFMTFNGDDAIALLHSGSIIDVIGQIGVDPGTEWGTGLTSTADNTLRRKATVVAGDANGSDAFDPSIEWDGYATDDVSGLGTHTMSCGPMLYVTPATLSGFNYNVGAGPSASQTYALSGTNLTGFPGNITVTAPVDYQISLDGSTWNSTLSVPYSSATLAATTIYVRLIAGLSAGTYNNEVIENSGGGAVTTAEVTCSGTVTGPTLLVSPSSISMSYVFGAGPSAEQTYSISGSSLGAGPITINAPANFEISLTSGSGFGSSVNISYTAPTLNATIIYVRLISGLAINNYSGTITNSGGGASVNVGVSGVVSDPAALPTVFLPGDLAIIGVNSNAKCETGDDGSDEISFVSFVNINTGTKFYATDNGYQRTTAGKWGDTEGVYEFTRTGGPISAGTVITFRFLNITPFVQFLSPDNGWTFTKVSGFGGNLVLNTNGDQIYFMQGGTWTNGAALHDATYTPGVYLFAFNTNDSWTDFGASTQESGLIPGMECFSMMPGVATDFIKFTAAVSGWSAISKRGWIDRINSTANWTDCRVLPTSDPLFTTYSCENYTNTVTPDYPAGYSISIAAGGFSPGIWTGSRDENWFNCGNWQDMTIPDHNVNVSIPSAGVTFEPTIGNPPTVPVVYIGAECNDIDVQTGRTLTMNHANSRLDVYGNMINNGTFSFTDGIVNFMEDNSTLSGTGNMDFYKLGMVKTTALNTLTISKDINISNSLLFTSGIITTGSFRVNVTNSATAAISGHVIPGSSAFTGFINGNLRRNVAATGSYDFPVGSATQYEYANINLISSSSLSYIDAFFTTPHSTTIDITPLNLMVGTSTLNELLNYGFWTITPNAGTYTYDVLLTERLHTNPGSSADAHTVVKRPNAASNWVLQGTHLNSTQSMGTTPVNWVTAKRSGLTVFSDFAIAKSNSGTLPVELLGFDAYLSNGNGFLSWSTASETNCRMFVVERSVNDMNEFVTVATIAGNGNSNMINKYLVEDKNVQPGINYYRLVQYDYDGTRNELGVRYLVMSNEDEPISIATISNDGNSVYADVINIRNGSFEVQILDASGKLVYSAISQSGDDAYRIKVYNLPSGGVYMMRVSDGISADVKKFMIF